MKQLSQFINEAKATYCGRCDTTHVPPAKGGTCPAVKEEHLPWHEDPKNPTRKVGVRKDQYGNVIKNVPKYLAKKAMQTNEEADLEENAKIVAHLQKRYGDNIRKSHVRSAANDFGVDASKLAKAVRTKLGKSMLDEEENDEGWYTHSQMYGSKKSEKHPKGISAAEWKSGIRWHHGKNKRINIKEEVEDLDEVSAAKLRDYADKASDARGHRNLPTAKLDKRYKSMALAHEKIRARHAKVDQIDELSKATSASYTKKAARSIAGLAANAAARAALHGKASEYDKRTLRNRITGVSRATDRMTKEETLKTLSQFIEEANNNLFEADQIKAHHERVKKLKGKKVSFTHPVSKQKITGTMQKIVQMGGLPYAHVETGKSAHRVPVHQID